MREEKVPVVRVRLQQERERRVLKGLEARLSQGVKGGTVGGDRGNEQWPSETFKERTKLESRRKKGQGNFLP